MAGLAQEAEPPDAAAVDPPPTGQPPVSARTVEDLSMVQQGAMELDVMRRAIHWPCLGFITTYFGEVGPTSVNGHSGIDIARWFGDPVGAPLDGLVLDAGWDPAYGNNVTLDHGNGFQTRFGHFQQLMVEGGERVARGQVIGYVGTTGYSTGPHLHFELWRHGVLMDPLEVLPRPYAPRPYPELPVAESATSSSIPGSGEAEEGITSPEPSP